MNIRVAVPRRADDGERDVLWGHCRRQWDATGWEVVEGHHDDGLFNRSAAINRAARGEWDVLVIPDGDVIVDMPTVERAVKEADVSGRMVLPFRERRDLTPIGTRLAVSGRPRGVWQRKVGKRYGLWFVSACVIVPRRLWDAVGGFDERFEGWGGEDDAFHAACKALGGPVVRLDGVVWHLHHKTSPARDWKAAHYIAARALALRYVATTDRQAMLRLLAEPRTPDQIVAVVLTCGGRDTLTDTLRTFDAHARGPIARRVIADDSGDPAWARRIAAKHPRWEVVAVGHRSGYAKATAAARLVAVGSGQPWIFWAEDDFRTNSTIDLRQIRQLMDAEPHLAQVSMMRQAWYPDELRAGSVLGSLDRSLWVQRDGWVEQRAYWTQNPHLVRRSFLAAHPWPTTPGSEARFGRDLLTDPAVACGVWGRAADLPTVTHIGDKRANHGKGH